MSARSRLPTAIDRIVVRVRVRDARCVFVRVDDRRMHVAMRMAVA